MGVDSSFGFWINEFSLEDIAFSLLSTGVIYLSFIHYFIIVFRLF